jgi:hypothetical protein
MRYAVPNSSSHFRFGFDLWALIAVIVWHKGFCGVKTDSSANLFKASVKRVIFTYFMQAVLLVC